MIRFMKRSIWIGLLILNGLFFLQGFSIQVADTTNIALNKTATASSQLTSSCLPFYANDGDTTTAGQGWSAAIDAAGEWWQVDLGSIENIYRIRIFASVVNPHYMYQKFHIDISTTGTFTGEEQRVVTENNWDLTRNGAQSVTYDFTPVNARYIRLTTDIEQGWVILQEFQVFRQVPVVRDGLLSTDLNHTNSTTQLSANWDASFFGTNIRKYWLAIGTTSGGTNVLNYTDVGNVTSYTRTGLSLQIGQRYYISVKSENTNGTLSSPQTSDGVYATSADLGISSLTAKTSVNTVTISYMFQ